MKTLIGLRQKCGSVLRIPSLGQRVEWDRVKGKLPEDLHPHVRRRIEFQRHIAKHAPDHMKPERLARVLADLEAQP